MVVGGGGRIRGFWKFVIFGWFYWAKILDIVGCSGYPVCFGVFDRLLVRESVVVTDYK